MFTKNVLISESIRMQKFLGLSKRKNYISEEELNRKTYKELEETHSKLMERYEVVSKLRATKKQKERIRSLMCDCGLFKDDILVDYLTRGEASTTIKNLEEDLYHKELDSDIYGIGQY